MIYSSDPLLILVTLQARITPHHSGSLVGFLYLLQCSTTVKPGLLTGDQIPKAPRRVPDPVQDPGPLQSPAHRGEHAYPFPKLLRRTNTLPAHPQRPARLHRGAHPLPQVRFDGMRAHLLPALGDLPDLFLGKHEKSDRKARVP